MVYAFSCPKFILGSAPDMARHFSITILMATEFFRNLIRCRKFLPQVRSVPAMQTGLVGRRRPPILFHLGHSSLIAIPHLLDSRAPLLVSRLNLPRTLSLIAIVSVAVIQLSICESAISNQPATVMRSIILHQKIRASF